MSADRPHQAPTAQPVLSVTGLDVHYGKRRALHGLTLTVTAGETLGIIGETGSGKSTFARTVLGLVRATAGSVVIDGEDVSAHRPRQWRALRRRGIVQYVFQDPLRSLDPDLTIEDSLTEPLLVQGVARPEAARRARALLDLLSSLRSVYVGMSAGSMVMAPNIGEFFVGWTPPHGGDKTLSLVDFAMFPHLDHEMLPHNTMTAAEKWAAGMQGPAYAIDDQTAIKVIDGAVEVVSEGHWKLFTP